MSNKIEYKGMIAFHPGYYLAEEMEYLGMNQNEFSRRLNTTPKTLSNILNGKISLSNDIIKKLSLMLGTSTDVWFNLQTSYYKVLAQKETDEKLSKESSILKIINSSFFKKLNIIDSCDNVVEQIKKLCKFWGVSSLEVLLEKDFLALYRTIQIETNEKNRINSMAWLNTALSLGREKKIIHFEKDKLLSSLAILRELTNKDSEEFLYKLDNIFSECGVTFIILPHLTNSKINGFVKWIDEDKVILAISDRKKTNDVFWFSLFHEIKHVLQGKKNKVLIDNDHFDDELLKLEEEADSFSKNILIPEVEYNEFIKYFYKSKEEILEFSEKIKIHPGIVLGRLQKDKIIKYSLFNDLKTHFELPYKQLHK